MAGSSVVIVGICNVGAYSYFGDDCLIGSCTIGRFCSIAPGVKIGLGEHPTHHVSTHPFFFASKNGFDVPDGIGKARNLREPKYSAPIIEDDVWIGANAVICKGVKIGRGAVVAAGAVVNKDVEPYSIVGGLPARHLKYRFDADIVGALLESKWWEYDVSSFVGLAADEPMAFVESLKVKSVQASYQRLMLSAAGVVSV